MMFVCDKAGDRPFKLVHSAVTLLVVGVATCGMAFAQERRAGGPTPSAEGSEVYFAEIKDGATIPTKGIIRFGLRGMGVAPAGADRPNSGHHHLLIDTELPPLDQPIPNDFNHLHFGTGQTEAEITLKPGPHTLQLLLGDKDHIPHNPPVMSPRIRVVVADKAPTEAAPVPRKRQSAKTRKPAKQAAKPRRVYPSYRYYPGSYPGFRRY